MLPINFLDTINRFCDSFLIPICLMFFARSSDDPSNGMAPPKTTTFQFYGQITHETDYSGDIKLLDEIRNTGSNTANFIKVRASFYGAESKSFFNTQDEI